MEEERKDSTKPRHVRMGPWEMFSNVFIVATEHGQLPTLIAGLSVIFWIILLASEDRSFVTRTVFELIKTHFSCYVLAFIPTLGWLIHIIARRYLKVNQNKL